MKQVGLVYLAMNEHQPLLRHFCSGLHRTRVENGDLEANPRSVIVGFWREGSTEEGTGGTGGKEDKSYRAMEIVPAAMTRRVI